MNDFNDSLILIYKWWEDEDQINSLIDCGIPKDVMDKILVTAELLQEIYPDLWDIQFRVTDKRLKPRAFIKFPEIEISNSEGLKHTIYDLYVRFNLTKITDDLFSSSSMVFNIDEIYGTRGKVSYAEITSGYMHSHLSSTKFKDIEFTNFCLGSSEIEQAMVLINTSVDDLDPNLIRYFLHHLQTYVNWESLEGGPYIKMSTIHRRGDEGALRDVGVNVYRAILNHDRDIVRLIHDLDVDLDSHGTAIVIDNQNLDTKVNNFFMNIVGSDTASKYMYYRDEGGVYYGNFEGVAKFQRKRDPIHFQGKEVHLEMVDEVPDEDSPVFVHPDIKKFIKKRIEYELRKKQAIVAFRETSDSI